MDRICEPATRSSVALSAKLPAMRPSMHPIQIPSLVRMPGAVPTINHERRSAVWEAHLRRRMALTEFCQRNRPKVQSYVPHETARLARPAYQAHRKSSRLT